MGRGLGLTLTVIAAAIEPAIAGAAETDIFRYAVTQGGLLLVVLVLMWYIRLIHQERLAEKDDRLAEKDERLQVLITLATDVKVALVKSVEANASHAGTIQNLSRAVEKIEDRRSSR